MRRFGYNLDLSGLGLPKFRLPSLRLRTPSIRLRLDLDDPRRFSEPLQFFFHLLMFVSLLAIFAGATGTGVVMLIAGAVVHVARASLVEIAAQRQARRERSERKRAVRLRSHRAARKAREAPAAQPAASARPAAAAEIRVTATPRLSARRAQAAAAQPGTRPARKQRVI
jgi:hypothetical protein